MKITKLPNNQDPKYIAKQKALEGCDKCPCCGENGSYTHNMILRHINEGIESYEIYTGNGLLNLFKTYKKTTYECHTCGAEWESEPYEVL